jgi:hypothetical protein
MRNIFALTKREQRVVIVVVMTLVAAMLAKHYIDLRSQPPPERSTSTLPTAAPLQSPVEEDETAAGDSP